MVITIAAANTAGSGGHAQVVIGRFSDNEVRRNFESVGEAKDFACSEAKRLAPRESVNIEDYTAHPEVRLLTVLRTGQIGLRSPSWCDEDGVGHAYKFTPLADDDPKFADLIQRLRSA